MNKNKLLWLPAFFGVLLLIVSYFDLRQFNSGSINPHSMLSREIPLVLLGFVSSSIVSILFIVFLLKKNWRNSIQSIISIFVFLICFAVGGAIGAAYLNAT